MRKILLGLLTAGAVGGVAMFATGAFFSDTETSTGNTFQAGALDLKISNTCHYYKDGQDVGCGANSNWTAKDLTNEVFFNFADLKPGDYGENTIDFKVVDNPAWMCANIAITQDENVVVEPEGTTDNTTTGELGKYLMLMWWRDNGDNILNAEETPLFGGPRTLNDWLTLGTGSALPLTFADSYLNWTTWPASTPPNTLPIPGNTEQYLGVAWCFGNMVATPGQGIGFTCNGSGDQNDAQTDKVLGTLTFKAEQHRNNPTFRCPEHQEPAAAQTNVD